MLEVVLISDSVNSEIRVNWSYFLIHEFRSNNCLNI